MATNTHPLISQLSFLNWNANGLKGKRASFLEFLSRNNIDVACISETHLVENERFTSPGYSVYRTDRPAPVASGGVAIIIKKKLKHYPIFLPQLNTIEACGIKIELNNGSPMTVIAAYKRPSARLHAEDIRLLFPDQSSTLLMGDLNSKNEVWGCRVTTPQGRQLLAATDLHGIHVVAPDEPTHYPSNINQHPDILDIALIKNFSFPLYMQSLAEMDSNHCPVLTSFSADVHNHQSRPLPLGHINWDIFQQQLDSRLQTSLSLQTKVDTDAAIHNLTTAISSSLKAATAFHQRPHTTTAKVALPLRIMRLIKAKHKMRRLWQSQRLPWQHHRLNQLVRTVRTELDNFRYVTYKNYLSGLSANDCSLWKETRRILREPCVIPSLKEADVHYLNDSEKCNILADQFEMDFTPNPPINLDHNREIEEHPTFPPTVPERINPTSPQEIHTLIKNLPVKKAAGHDLIPNVALKHLTRRALALLASIFNSLLRQGYFPDTWKHAVIIAIHKPGKPSHSPSSYRPISLLSALSKLFEKVISRRLNKFLTESSILPHHQFGFRQKHSTTHQLLRLTEQIARGFEIKHHTVAAFLDFTKAFDKVWHKGLAYKLQLIRTPNYLYKVIHSFLSQRTFSVRINSTSSSPRPVIAGVPQGSILGPTLFNIYTHDIPTSSSSNIAMYADDTAVFTSHYDISVATRRLQSSLHIISSWLENWRISLNVPKCETMLFTLRRPQLPPPVTINGTAIPWSPKDKGVKYLGVFLDRRLTWKYHINQKLNLGYARLIKLYPLLNRKSSLKPECGLLLYRSLLRPLLTYACPVWGGAAETTIRRLQSYQNKVLRIIANAPWYVRNNQLHREFQLNTLKQVIATQARSFYKNIQRVPGAVFFNLGNPSPLPRRIKSRLPQDLLLPQEVPVEEH